MLQLHHLDTVVVLLALCTLCTYLHVYSLSCLAFCDGMMILYKVAVLVYKVLHCCALSYLGPFTQYTYIADLPSCQGLRFSCSDCLVQPPVHRSSVGSRAFSVAGSQVWNCLPPQVTPALSLTTFCSQLEMFLITKRRFHRLGLS